MVLGQPIQSEEDAYTYRYPFAGGFGLGPVEVRFLAGTFQDDAGNLSGEASETFTVTGATADPWSVRWT